MDRTASIVVALHSSPTWGLSPQFANLSVPSTTLDDLRRSDCISPQPSQLPVSLLLGKHRLKQWHVPHPNILPVCPFNDHRSQLNGSRFFCYNSPAAAAREVFKPSTDAESRLGSIQKKIF